MVSIPPRIEGPLHNVFCTFPRYPDQFCIMCWNTSETIRLKEHLIWEHSTHWAETTLRRRWKVILSNSSTVQVSRTRTWLCFPPSQQKYPHQNLPEGSTLQTWNLALRLNSQVTTAMDGHLLSLGWSPTNPMMVSPRRKYTTNSEFGN